MASEPKKNKTDPAPKKADAPAKVADAPAKVEAPAADKSTPAEAVAKVEGGDATAAPSNYSRGEGQKPVTRAYKENWNAIFAKKSVTKSVTKSANKSAKRKKR
jgi:hypothetical protein